MEDKYGKALNFNDPELIYQDDWIPIVFTHSRKEFE